MVESGTDASRDHASSWHALARGSALVLAAALAAHVASLRAGWVLDDWELLVDNPYLRSASGLRAVLTQELFVASADPRRFPYYRPVSGAMYWLTYQLFGASSVAHHAFNVALHALCAVLFFHLARRLGVAARAALFMGVVFAVHPISVEVVAYAGGRQDALGWIFTFGTMLLVLRAPRLPRIVVLSFVGTLLAALTREFFLAAPALHAAAAASAASAGEGKRAHRTGVAAGGGALAALVVLAIRRALDITPFGTANVTPARAIGAAGSVLARFVKDVLAPTDIAADVTVIPMSAGAGAFVLLGTAVASFVAHAAVKKRMPGARSAFLVGSVAFAVLVALHAPVALRFGIISDRYAYGAVAAVLLAAAPAIEAVIARIDPAKKVIYVGAVAGLAVALIPLTWARAADYTNDVTLTLALVRDRPDDPRAILSRIVTLRSEGRSAEAYPLCHAHADLLPDDIVVNPCLAEEAFAQKEDARVVTLLEPWLRAQPRDQQARTLYLQALFRMGDLARVQRELDRFEAVSPNAPDLRAAREALDEARRTK
jgi:hypothetical protein